MTNLCHGRLLIILLSFQLAYLKQSIAVCEPSKDNLTELTDYLNCAPMQIGSSIVIDDKEKPSPAGPPRKFILHKKDDFTYQVQLNLKFLENDVVRQLKDIVTNTETPKETQMRNHVNYCLNKYNPYLKGPNNHKLEILLTDRKSTDPNVKRIETPITIGEGDGFQVHSLAYKSDSSCLTLLHEILHRLGLVDEYIEIRTKLADGSPLNSRDCRILGNPSSIMNDAALMSEKDFINRTRFMTVSGEVCSCDDMYNCPKQAPSNNCNEPGYKKEFRRADVVEKTSPEVAQSILAMNIGFTSMKAPPPSKVMNIKTVTYLPTDSFLLPAHFRFITKPLCKKENYKYTSCGSRSNKGTSYRLFFNDTTCENPPIYCKNGEWLL